MTCDRCGANLAPQSEPVTVSGDYDGRRYAWEGGPPILRQALCSSCVAPAQEEIEALHQRLAAEQRAHDAAADDEAYLGSLPAEERAELEAASLRTLQRRAKAAGQARPRGRPALSAATQERLDLLAQGLSPQVATETDCTPQAVRELRRRYLDED